MSFIEQTQANSRRTKAIVGVAAIHALIAYGLISGLTIDDFEQFIDRPFIGTQIPLPPPPVPDPTPEPSPAAKVENPVAPAPPIPIPRPVPFPVDTFDPADIPDDTVIRIPTPRPDPGPSITPRPLFTPTPPSPLNGPAGWIRTEDYPSAPLRIGAEGTSSYRLVIGTDGKVDACEILASTGNKVLDDTTCRLLTRRARFDAAKSDQGARIVGTYTGSVTWQIPD